MTYKMGTQTEVILPGGPMESVYYVAPSDAKTTLDGLPYSRFLTTDEISSLVIKNAAGIITRRLALSAVLVSAHHFYLYVNQSFSNIACPYDNGGFI